MEIVLSKYSNFLLGSKEAKVIINDDCLQYSYLSNPNTVKYYHYSFLLHGLFTIEDEKKCFVIPKQNKQIIFFTNLSNPDEKVILFGNYYNYLKYVFEQNTESHQFLNLEKFKLNTREMFLSMNLYTTNNYYIEIYANTKSNKLIASSVLETIQKKANTEELKFHFDKIKKDEVNFIDDLKKDIDDIFYNDNADQHFSSEMKKKDENKHNLESIDKVREYYLALIRILIEIRRSFNERMIAPSPLPSMILSNTFNKYDLLSRLLFAKGDNVNFGKLSEQNQELKNIYKEAQNANKELRGRLKEFVEQNNLTLYYCVRCGHILTKTEKTSSNCYFDSDCRSNSFFYCKMCNINYCTYCILYPKKMKCSHGHLLKPYINKDTRNSCDVCGNNIMQMQCYYYCNDCFAPTVCAFCYEDIKNNEIIPGKCICGKDLQWKRGVVHQCRKCQKKKKCFWFCLFCKYYYCTKCFGTIKNRCGMMHKMTEINLNLVKINLNKEYSNEKGKYVNRKVNDIIHGYRLIHKSSCDNCLNPFCFKFSLCVRCSFLKCQECNK